MNLEIVDIFMKNDDLLLLLYFVANPLEYIIIIIVFELLHLVTSHLS